MKRIIEAILNSMAGKKKRQILFEYLHKLSLRGMNIGEGAVVDTSGERLAIEYISEKLNKINRITVFDVGANIGTYSISLIDMFKEKIDLFAFEPSRKTYEKLKLNTKGLANLNLYNFGFGNENAIIPLFSNKEESELASLYQRKLDHFNIEMNKTEEIEIKTLDSFCLQHNIKHIHFLKIDVEGHEIKVLEGAKNILYSKEVDFIQFEFGGCNIDSRTFFQDFFYLLKDDYYIYRIVKDGLYKIDTYKELYETFATTNYLAERIFLSNGTS